MLEDRRLIWLKSDWRGVALNFTAVMIAAYVLSQGNMDWSTVRGFDAMLASGKWAIRFLLFCLAMTPANTYFGWRSAVKLRKPAGLWAFGFAGLHLALYVREAKLTWLSVQMPIHIALGLAGLLILSALAVTSNRTAMQWLGKTWKRLHRLVYCAGVAVTCHSLLAIAVSKKVHVYDPQAVRELGVYALAMSVLLMVRIPQVRGLLLHIPTLLRQPAQIETPVGAAPIVERPPDFWPPRYGRESAIPFNEFAPTIELEPETIESREVTPVGD